MAGKLYLCATPIGNLGDVSKRCLETLSSVDLVAAEDTRRTLQLLNHFEISKPLTSYHEHNKREKGAYIISLLENGKNVALVSDAGTPAISDPGEDLVRLCAERSIEVTSIPGPAAFVNALILSGLSTSRFSFEGFLSVNKRHRREHLESVKNDTRTLIFYEAPHKLVSTVEDMRKAFGGDRRVALVREITKIHEEVMRSTLDEAALFYSENKPRGEYVIVVEGADVKEASAQGEWEDIPLREHIDKYIAEGMTSKEAIKRAALERDIPKREAYNEYHRSVSEE